MADPPSSASVASEPVLELDTLVVEHPTIKIRSKKHPEGKLYELAVMADFGIEEQQQLTVEGREFDALWQKDDLNDNEKLRLRDLLDCMFSRIVRFPRGEADVKSALNDAQKSQIVMAFTIAPLAMAAARSESQNESQTTES